MNPFPLLIHYLITIQFDIMNKFIRPSPADRHSNIALYYPWGVR